MAQKGPIRNMVIIDTVPVVGLVGGSPALLYIERVGMAVYENNTKKMNASDGVENYYEKIYIAVINRLTQNFSSFPRDSSVCSGSSVLNLLEEVNIVSSAAYE